MGEVCGGGFFGGVAVEERHVGWLDGSDICVREERSWCVEYF